MNPDPITPPANTTTEKPEETAQIAEGKIPKPPVNPPPGAKILLPKINWQPIQDLIAKLEAKLSTKVICYYVSPRDWMQSKQADIFLEHLKRIGYQQNLTLLMVGPGGDPTAALRIAAIVREYCQNLQMLIPSQAASASTTLSLAADKIIMSAAGYLTAIDASLVDPLNPKGPTGKPVSISIEQIKRITSLLDKEGPAIDTEDKTTVGTYRTLFKYVHPLVVAEITRNSSLSELIAIKMMKMHPQSFENEEKITEIARKLVNDYPVHSFPILYQEAKEIGLPVEKADRELSELMWELVKLYDLSSQVRTTNFQPNFFHYEEFPIVVESTGFRTTYRFTYNKRFNPVLKTGDTENNMSGWYSITASDSDKLPFKMTPLDVPASQDEKPAPSEDNVEETVTNPITPIVKPA